MDAQVVARAEVAACDPRAAEEICARLGPGPFALVAVFIAPGPDLRAIVRDVDALLRGTPVIGCTTAGEIGASGYVEGHIVAIGLSAHHFRAETLLIDNISAIDPRALIGALIRARGALADAVPAWQHEFAFLLVDGLSTKEDELASALAAGMGPVPLFGGSAADGTRFLETFVFHRGQVLRNAAVLAFVRTCCPVRVFKADHLRPTDRRMVVTDADPARRIVRQINAEPAALEYARLVGKDPHQLSPFTFAAHPVSVRIGGQHFVRSIRQVADNHELVFYSAIDEGLVLTVAEAQDMTAHLESLMADLSHPSAPLAILACDCILRRMEAEEKQLGRQVSDLLAQHRAVGFSTYGEQFNAMHVNQTLTGVAFYAPEGVQP